MDSINNSCLSNGTTNISVSSCEPAMPIDLGLSTILMGTLTLLLVTCAWTLNIIVLIAIDKIDECKLKMQFLLQNAIAGDMLLALSLGVKVIYLFAGSDENNTSLASLCANVAHDFTSYIAALYQILASLAVAMDRFYSILRPLDYHTMKYTARKKIAIFLVLFCLSFGLSVPILTTKLKPGDPFVMICYRTFGRSGWAEEVLPFVLVFVVFLTMFTYCSIFTIVVFHLRMSRDVLGQQSEGQAARKGQASLALTFFLVHITYIVLYLPGALYFSVLSVSVRSQPELHFLLEQLTTVIYLMNTVVDPLIYIFRVRSIRGYIRKLCSSRGRRPELRAASGTGQEQSELTMTYSVNKI